MVARIGNAGKGSVRAQKQFADFLMISVRTLQKWEQGKRNPDGAAHALLRVMEREPDAVLRALHD